jgi:hypothetical protein
MDRRRRDSDRSDDLVNPYHWYTPRFWDGMRMGTWLRLMLRHRFACSLSRLSVPLGSALLTPFASICHFWQELRWRRRVESTPMSHPPLFVLGHWRSGTTFLHELLVCDSRYTYPTTYDCFSPNDFLSTGDIVSRWFAFLVPDRRPMDNMSAGWDRPQEDEFALMNMGVPSIYETLAFPNHGPQRLEYLDFEGLSVQEIERWKRALVWFLQRVNFRDPRRIVLKSPPHMARIKPLLELFPDAHFIHIVRDPYRVFPSSVRLWKALLETQSMQVPRRLDLEEFIFNVFERLYAAFERQRELIEPGHFCEVRYEDLVADPIPQLEMIYDQLGLGDFDSARPQVAQHLAAIGRYRTNPHKLESSLQDKITSRWGDYAKRYGYAPASV